MRFGRRRPAAAARVRRPHAGGRAAALHGRGRAPARAPGAVGLRPVVPDRAAQRGAGGGGACDHRGPAAGGGAGVGGRDPDALPAVRRAQGSRGGGARTHRLLPSRRAGPAGLLQPAAVLVVLVGVRRARPRRACCSAGRWASRSCTRRSWAARARLGFTQEPLAQFDFTHPAAVGFYADLVREAVAGGADGWMEDFGESTPPAVAPVRRQHRRRRAQPLSDRLPLRAPEDRAELRPPAGALPALGLDRQPRAVPRWSGAATRPRSGASTASARP